MCFSKFRISLLKWWAHLGSNQGPTGYEPVALPAELWAQRHFELTNGGSLYSIKLIVKNFYRSHPARAVCPLRHITEEQRCHDPKIELPKGPGCFWATIASLIACVSHWILWRSLFLVYLQNRLWQTATLILFQPLKRDIPAISLYCRF